MIKTNGITKTGKNNQLKFIFPRDEGRHSNYNESWYFCFNLVSELGYKYSFHSMYAIKAENELCYKFCSFTDISNQEYFYKTDTEPYGDFKIDNSKLNITFDHYSHTDRIYQIKDKPFNYFYSVGLTDRNLNPIVLNCTMKCNKNPIIINATLLNERVFDNPSNKLYYYAQTNIDIYGNLTINRSIIPVTGSAWIDREWGQETMTTVEWFAIQLDNNYEIAASKIYKDNKNFSLGFLILPNSSTIDISKDLSIITFNRTNRGFSNQWMVSSYNQNFNLSIEADMDNQVIITFPKNTLFEGSCSVSGFFQDQPAKGFCFSEQNYKKRVS